MSEINVNTIPPDVMRELEAIEQARAGVAKRKAAAEDARKAAAEEPLAMLAEARITLAREKREADVADHEIMADQIYRDAAAKHGDDKVERVVTRYGSIVMRFMTALEMDAATAREQGHRVSPNANAVQRAAAEQARLQVHRIAVRAAILTPLEHFDRVLAENQLLWEDIFAARNALIDASELAAGKAAPR